MNRLLPFSLVSFVLLSGSCRVEPEGVDSGLEVVELTALEASALETVRTVIRVDWSLSTSTQSWVEFGESEALGRSTIVSEADTNHDAFLVGFPAETEVFYRVVWTDDAGSESYGPTQQVTTGALPASLPELTLQRGTESLDTFLGTSITGAAWAAIIMNDRGQIVWYALEERGFNVYRTRLARDGQSILYNAVGVGNIDLYEGSEIVRIGFDGEIIESYNVPWMTHDFVELPDGDLMAIAYDFGGTEDDEDPVRGDKLVRVNIEDGSTETFWSTWDVYDPSTHGYQDGDSTWTHANALDYSDEDDALYLGIRDMGTIIKLDAQTAEVEWGLSGDANSFTWIGEGDGWELEHQFELQGNRMLVFDNGNSERASSYVQEYTLDFDAMTAERTWLHEAEPPLFVWALGDVDTLPSGDLLVTYATSGLYQRINRGGTVLWELGSPLGYAAGYTTLISSLDSVDL